MLFYSKSVCVLVEGGASLKKIDLVCVNCAKTKNPHLTFVAGLEIDWITKTRSGCKKILLMPEGDFLP